MSFRHFDFWGIVCDRCGVGNGEDWTAWLLKPQAESDFLSSGGELVGEDHICPICLGKPISDHDHLHGDGPGQHTH